MSKTDITAIIYQVKRIQQSQVPKVASIGVTSNPGAMLILFPLTLSHTQSLGGHTRKGYGAGEWRCHHLNQTNYFPQGIWE